MKSHVVLHGELKVQEPGKNESTWIDMPPKFLLHGSGGQIGCIVSDLYPELNCCYAIQLFLGCFVSTNSMSVFVAIYWYGD